MSEGGPGCTPIRSVLLFLVLAILLGALIYFMLIIYLAYSTD